MQKKKLLLFDFDGTVIDNSEGIFNCVRYAAEKYGYAAPEAETLRRFVGPPLYDSFMRFFGADHETALKLVDAYRERYRPIGTTEAVLYHGIRKALSLLQTAGYTLAVCSGKPLEFVEKIAGLLEIKALFSGFYCTSLKDTGLKKSDYILRAMADFGMQKQDTVMIGDTKSDILAAKEAGVDSIGVTYGFAAPGELEAAGADVFAKNTNELYTLLTGRPLPQTCVIFGAGEYDAFRPVYKDTCFYIAADGGLRQMQACGVRPDLLIGDFDSLDIALPEGVPTRRLPVAKDVTDMDAAVTEGLKRGFTDFMLLGGMGGRPDHTVANYSLLARLSQQGCSAVMYGAGFAVTAVTNGAAVFPAECRGTAAVVSWSDKSEEVTISGFLYELTNGTLRNTYALGVSNSFIGKPASVSVKTGTLLIMYENKR